MQLSEWKPHKWSWKINGHLFCLTVVFSLYWPWSSCRLCFSESIFLHLSTLCLDSQPLQCASHHFIVDLNIDFSISAQWASFSIITICLQWYCDDKKKHCNKLPDWDNIMTPLEYLRDSMHQHHTDPIPSQPANLIQWQSACKCSLRALWGRCRVTIMW